MHKFSLNLNVYNIEMKIFLCVGVVFSIGRIILIAIKPPIVSSRELCMTVKDIDVNLLYEYM